MSMPLSEELTDAVYRAALEPQAWHDVMGLIQHCFPSSAQTFYFLHLEPRQVRPVCLRGVDPKWLRSFDQLYFAPDNPWIRVTRFLHRPGVVRTTERLERFMNQPGVLYRSSYYNDWMRPQGFKYNVGNTLLAEDGIVANITLFRAPDQGTFCDAEVASFEWLSKHMTRSLQMSVRLAQPQQGAVNAAALDALPHAVALVDARRRVLYSNPAMESVLRRQHGLLVRGGELCASEAAAEPKLAALVSGALGIGAKRSEAMAPQTLPCPLQRQLSVRAIPVAQRTGSLPLRPTVLLLASECAGRAAMGAAEIRARYGCTASEARLAEWIAQGLAVRQAAALMGVTYGTARAYLKLVFQKVGVHTQAQLVAQLLADTPSRAADRSAAFSAAVDA